MQINNCFDSHLHWQGIGSFKSRLSLSSLKSAHDLKKLTMSDCHYRESWLLGHGWLDSFCLEGMSPRDTLDTLFPHTPVYFTTPDIHSVRLNSLAIKRLGIDSSSWKLNYKNYVDSKENKLLGAFHDLAKDFIDQKLPAYTDSQVKQHLLEAQKVIHQAGVTHIRDLTCSEQQFRMACELEKSNQLSMVVDLFFKLNHFDHLSSHIQTVKKMSSVPTQNLNIKGVKVFIDGALGSGGALLSEKYLNGHQGFTLFSQDELKEIFIQCYANNLELAFHVIGDQACDNVCSVALELQKKGVTGTLHLEHVQILSTETIRKIAQLGATCHMQPQHWCSDKKWLSEKISPQLISKSFRWADLDKAKIPFYFGSDAPVEDMSVGHLLFCLKQAEKDGIANISKSSLSRALSYPGNLRGSTFISQDGRVEKVLFDNNIVYQS